MLEWTLLNSFIAYLGYLLAAVHIDKPWMGRMRLQSLGFLMSFILFICCGAAYHQLVHPGKLSSKLNTMQPQARLLLGPSFTLKLSRCPCS